jgi:rRNA maturation protein Nop10
MSDEIKPAAALQQNLPTNTPDPESWARYAAGELRTFVAIVPTDHDKNTIDFRGNARQVLCGDCGTFTSSRDVCPNCGGHAEPVPHPPTIERLRRASIFARWAIRRAAARRRKEVLRNAVRHQ